MLVNLLALAHMLKLRLLKAENAVRCTYKDNNNNKVYNVMVMQRFQRPGRNGMNRTTDSAQNLLGLTQEEAEELSRLAAAWRGLPEHIRNRTLPDTPEMRDAVFNLLIGMYGEALKELERL